MLIRVMLVGLVTSLGLELPSEGDLDSCVRAGRDFCQARLTEWDASMPTDASAFTDPAELVATPSPEINPEAWPSPDVDVAFAAVMDEMIGTFANEQAAEQIAIAFASLPPQTDDVIDTALALELGRAAEPLVGGAWAEPLVNQGVAAQTPVADEVAAPSRGARLAAAVRLTSQAAHAWASLLRGSTQVLMNP